MTGTWDHPNQWTTKLSETQHLYKLSTVQDHKASSKKVVHSKLFIVIDKAINANQQKQKTRIYNMCAVGLHTNNQKTNQPIGTCLFCNCMLEQHVIFIFLRLYFSLIWPKSYPACFQSHSNLVEPHAWVLIYKTLYHNNTALRIIQQTKQQYIPVWQSLILVFEICTY